MLAYTARSKAADDTRRPRLLVPIVVGHLVLIGLVLTAHMGGARQAPPAPLVVQTYRVPPPPLFEPTPKPTTKADPQPAPTSVDPIVSLAALPKLTDILVPPDLGSIGDGTGIAPAPVPLRPLIPELPNVTVRTAPKLATAEEFLRPPYPAARREAGVEAALTLKLSIDQRGRVTAVDAVGTADPAFLASARTHLIRAWRFEPATEDGKPVASTKTITLRFQLGDD